MLKVTQEIIAAGIIGLLVGWTGGELITPPAAYAPETNELSGTAALERYFIEQMIPHHQGALAMANVAMQKSETDEVRNLSESILTTQQQEVDQMSGWYKEWFGQDLPMNAMHAGHNDLMMGDLSALNKARNFDTEFVRQMIAHHEGAVLMSQMLLAVSPRAELKTLAEEIIDTQTEEITLMKGWLARWTR